MTSNPSHLGKDDFSALDNRRGITRLTVNIPEASVNPVIHHGDGSNRSSVVHTSGSKEQIVVEVEPSRWKTKEFRFYGACFLIVVPFMIWWPIRLSSPSHPNYLRFQHKLSPGWIPGRKIDISDPQYRTFRQNIPALLTLAGVHVCSSWAFGRYRRARWRRRERDAGRTGDHTAAWTGTMEGSARGSGKARFMAAFSIGTLILLHGINALKILLILYINHRMLVTLTPSPPSTSHTPFARTASTSLISLVRGKRWSIPACVWVFNCAVLWMNDWYDGYPFGSIATGLSFLDNYAGLLPRWHVLFNVTMLRLISFGMDFHYALRTSPAGGATQSDSSGRTIDTAEAEDFELIARQDEADTTATSRQSSPTRGAALQPASPVGHKARVRTSLHLKEYNFVNLVAYALYPPLYNAGPIMTFNDFVWQLREPLALSRKSTFTYSIRFAASLLTMELVLHFMYVVAIKDASAWEGDTPADLSMIGLWNLVVVWLKLLLPWRFFRLWALLDGMDPPENMVRCVLNNYSTLGFWKSWHRSYNLWVVRYVYVPVGGARNMIPATLLVFTFVALWHDLSFRLLTWGWLVSLFVIPELAAKAFLPPNTYSTKWWYRHVCAIGAIFNILMMMIANLVGFVIGVDGVRHLLSQLVASRQGLYFSVFSFICIFIHAQVLMEYRATEARQGISRRC